MGKEETEARLNFLTKIIHRIWYYDDNNVSTTSWNVPNDSNNINSCGSSFSRSKNSLKLIFAIIKKDKKVEGRWITLILSLAS
jgi:hypothetical protein